MKNTVIKGDYKNWYLSIHKEMDKLILEGINDNIEISNKFSEIINKFKIHNNPPYKVY